MRISTLTRTLFGTGLLLGASLALQAQNPVTFSVNMTSQPSAADVYVKGSFDSWGAGQQLFNDGSGVYTGTVDIALSPGTVIFCKYMYNPGGVWENGADRQFALAGGAQTLPLTAWDEKYPAPVNQITFQVDMTGVTNVDGSTIASDVLVSGGFNNWSGTANPLTNNGAGIWSETVNVTGFAGSTFNYKFLFNPGGRWEDDITPQAHDRPCTIVGGAQTLPLVPFNAIYPVIMTTNNITFQVDMRVQGQAWINGGGRITVSGGFNGWGDSDDYLLTNDPAATFPTNWFYSGTFSAATQLIPASAPAWTKLNRFKFRANGGWEEPIAINANLSNDRWWDASTEGDKVLPLVLYSDASLCDTLSEDTTVTFVLHITNGTQTITGHAFDKAVDTIHINGESLLGTWQTWSSLFCPQLVNNPPGSDFYEYTQIIPAGRPRNQKVKYGIDYVGNPGNIDNEAPSGQDHIQWIRTTNNVYVMTPVEFGTNYASVRVQPQFGNLKVGAPAAGNVPVTWDGCACVTLQQRSSLTSGNWIDLPETDGSGSTNMPNAGTQFFRLQKRSTP